jgi:hypothetical protein
MKQAEVAILIPEKIKNKRTSSQNESKHSKKLTSY